MQKTPRVFIASDHRGFNLKKKILEVFPDFSDLGPEKYDAEDDYNEPAVRVAGEVLKNPGAFGVLICGSAIGISIQANRFRGIRAAIISDEKSARLSREHNNANIICFSADNFNENPEIFPELASALRIFLKTPFSAEPRHARRVEKLDYDYYKGGN